MKIFNEYPNKDDLLLCLEDENDPASIKYKRVLTYPKINKLKVFLNIIFSLIGITIVAVLLWLITKNKLITIFSSIGVLFVYLFLRLKSIIIFTVELYQLLAPERVRMKCRFEPSCSDYMIISVKKYGAIKGLIRGIKRIKRCKYPNGGYDEP